MYFARPDSSDRHHASTPQERRSGRSWTIAENRRGATRSASASRRPRCFATMSTHRTQSGRAETLLASPRTHVFDVVGDLRQACSTADDNRPRGTLRSSPPISARGWNLQRPGAAHLQSSRRWSGLSKGTLDRCLRDILTANQHVIATAANLRDDGPPAARPRAPAVAFLIVRRSGAECRR